MVGVWRAHTDQILAGRPAPGYVPEPRRDRDTMQLAIPTPPQVPAHRQESRRTTIEGVNPIDVVLLQAVDVILVEGKHDRLEVVEMVQPQQVPDFMDSHVQ